MISSVEACHLYCSHHSLDRARKSAGGRGGTVALFLSSTVKVDSTKVACVVSVKDGWRYQMICKLDLTLRHLYTFSCLYSGVLVRESYHLLCAFHAFPTLIVKVLLHLYIIV